MQGESKTASVDPGSSLVIRRGPRGGVVLRAITLLQSVSERHCCSCICVSSGASMAADVCELAMRRGTTTSKVSNDEESSHSIARSEWSLDMRIPPAS